MAIVEVTKDNFDEVVDNNDVVILDFWAEWCGPCKTFAPVFEATSEKYPDVVFGKVNTEDQGELAGHFDIRYPKLFTPFIDNLTTEGSNNGKRCCYIPRSETPKFHNKP